jgi:hypothetical protein
MERQTQIIIGGVVFVILGYAVYHQSQKDKQKGAPPSKADLPELKATDDVDKIDVKNGDKGEVILEKHGDKWELVSPVKAPANQSNVSSALSNLKDIKITESITSNLDDALKKTYELDDAKGVHIVTFKGAEKKFEATFGKSGGRGNMVMLPGHPGVYSASGYSGWMFQRDAKEWRDKEIFKFDDANVVQLTIINTNGTLSFTKGGDKWAGTFKDKPIARFDESKVKDALSALKNLMAEDFGDGKPASDTGLDAPSATVTVTLKDNAGKYTLKVGKTSSGESHYAQKEGDSTVYVVSQYPLGFVLANVDKYQQPADAGTDAAAKDSGK